MTNRDYLVLAGGVGAAKFIDGLARIVDQTKLKIIINTADDIELYGLKICPDIDIITYTLANIVDREKGWGFYDETYNCLKILKNYYHFNWFNLGDKDLATHIFRTDLFRKGYNKTEVTSMICKKLGVKAQLIPMCNEEVQTFIKTDSDLMHFEEFYIKHNSRPNVINIIFKGIENAKLSKEILNCIKEAKRIIISPSNPIVSIGTILQVRGFKDALKKVKSKVFAISPIIEGKTIKGPADKLMRSLSLEVSCVGVAKYYQEVIGHFILDSKDVQLKEKVEDLGIKAYCYDTIMKNIDKKKELAQFVLEIEN